MLLVDTHVHVYPHYDPALLLGSAVRQLRAMLPHRESPATLALVLVEREGTCVFARWLCGTGLPPGTRVEALDATALRLVLPGDDRLMILAGRQVACLERLEILGLGCQAMVRDGVPADDAVRAFADSGGLPVLAWGVGKWLFHRARVVHRLLDCFGPMELLLGDSSLRPVGWPLPLPMRRARREGRRILAGSDPLPSAGEERLAGRYATMALPFDPRTAEGTATILAALRDPTVRIESVGRRNTPWEWVQRMGLPTIRAPQAERSPEA